VGEVLSRSSDPILSADAASLGLGFSGVKGGVGRLECDWDGIEVDSGVGSGADLAWVVGDGEGGDGG
jgi:hypothetical protein